MNQWVLEVWHTGRETQILRINVSGVGAETPAHWGLNVTGMGFDPAATVPWSGHFYPNTVSSSHNLHAIHLLLSSKLLLPPEEICLFLFSQLGKLLSKYILKLIKCPFYPFLNGLLVIMFILKSKSELVIKK